MAADPIENYSFFPNNHSNINSQKDENDNGRIFTNSGNDYEQLPLKECIKEFLDAVNEMNSCILYKSRLVEIEIDSKMEEYLSKACSFTRMPISNFEPTTLQPYYSMVKDFKESIEGEEGTEVPIIPNVINSYHYFEKKNKSSSNKAQKNSLVESCYKNFDFVTEKFKLLIKTFTDLARYITKKYQQHILNLQKSSTSISYQAQI